MATLRAYLDAKVAVALCHSEPALAVRNLLFVCAHRAYVRFRSFRNGSHVATKKRIPHSSRLRLRTPRNDNALFFGNLQPLLNYPPGDRSISQTAIFSIAPARHSPARYPPFSIRRTWPAARVGTQRSRHHQRWRCAVCRRKDCLREQDQRCPV
jgi:hypothetical protein